MLENMAGAVGFAMCEDRLAKAAKNAQLADAKQKRQGSPRVEHLGYPAEIAAALVVLAGAMRTTGARRGARNPLSPR